MDMTKARRRVRVLTTKQVVERVKYTRAYIYRLERDGKFPQRIHLGKNRVVWMEDEIDEWIMNKARKRVRVRVRANQ